MGKIPTYATRRWVKLFHFFLTKKTSGQVPKLYVNRTSSNFVRKVSRRKNGQLRNNHVDSDFTLHCTLAFTFHIVFERHQEDREKPKTVLIQVNFVQLQSQHNAACSDTLKDLWSFTDVNLTFDNGFWWRRFEVQQFGCTITVIYGFLVKILIWKTWTILCI